MALMPQRLSDLIFHCVELIWCSLTPWLSACGHMALLATAALEGSIGPVVSGTHRTGIRMAASTIHQQSYSDNMKKLLWEGFVWLV